MELGSLVKKRTHLYFAVEKMTSVASEPLCRGSMAYVGIYWCLERLLQRLNEEQCRSMREHLLSVTEMCQR